MATIVQTVETIESLENPILRDFVKCVLNRICSQWPSKSPIIREHFDYGMTIGEFLVFQKCVGESHMFEGITITLDTEYLDSGIKSEGDCSECDCSEGDCSDEDDFDSYWSLTFKDC